MIIGRVIDSEIVENRDGDAKVILIRAEISDPDDLQHVEVFRQPGIDAHPSEGSALLIANVGAAWKVAIASDDNIEPEVKPGEIAIYSVDNGAKAAQVYCKDDGSIEAGLSNLSAVAIAAKVDKIISDIMSVFSSWVVAPNDGGAALKAAWASQFGTPPASVASSNLKAEE
jgi:hypothetical protein